MNITEGLNPEKVFRYFEEICAIPHGSHNLEQISSYLVKFAEDRKLKYRQDEVLNVVIWKDGSEGYEASEPVILQGHMDMVAVKEAGCSKDLRSEGLDLAIDGDLLYAKKTSLGGDDGIALAYALAILDDETIPHPPLEVVITTNEEVGLLGAAALDTSDLKGRMLLNLDSEDEGIFTVSCAGGVCASCIHPVETEEKNGEILDLRLDGFIGGHSGAEIHLGRANAIVLLGKVLSDLYNELGDEMRLIFVNGGEADNAIAIFAEATLSVPDAAATEALLTESFKKVSAKYLEKDPALKITVSKKESSTQQVLKAGESSGLVKFLAQLPYGVQKMSPKVPGLVQTSLNPGLLEMTADTVQTAFSVRSSVDAEKEALVDDLRRLCSETGGHVETTGDYPGWDFLPESRLCDTMVEAYREQYGKDPVVEGIHAGLECGIFAQKLPGIDAVSIGPQMQNIHTTRERLSISSTERTWKLILNTLKKLK
ncbi:MAG: aminoacyl-histidine dipeptidase [Eubacteriales bacterium]|nr:aminoacyl-histidine dipeptidase [Eubacteriales bacterium]